MRSFEYQKYTNNIYIYVHIMIFDLTKYVKFFWNAMFLPSRYGDRIAAAPLSYQKAVIYIWTTNVTLAFDLLTREWYTTHRSFMACIRTTYQADPSNRHWAPGGHSHNFERPVWTGPSTFYVTHCHLVCCICTTYRANLPNEHGTMKSTQN